MTTTARSVATPTGVATAKLGVWLFLGSEVMFFGSLVGAYLVLRMGAASWPDPTTILDTALLGVNTFVLITSSLTMVFALRAIERGDVAQTRRFLLATAALGAAFLAIKAFDYSHLAGAGFVPRSSLFASTYYLLTGFHGLHVLGGVATLLTLAALSRRRGFGGRGWIDRVEGAGLYWHFVDVVWIVLFAVLCLV